MMPRAKGAPKCGAGIRWGQSVFDFTPAPAPEAVPEWKRHYLEGKALHDAREAKRKETRHEAVQRMTAQPLSIHEWMRVVPGKAAA